jgi:hypothetical protein
VSEPDDFEQLVAAVTVETRTTATPHVADPDPHDIDVGQGQGVPFTAAWPSLPPWCRWTRRSGGVEAIEHQTPR